jgi:transcription antitermination factor NusG
VPEAAITLIREQVAQFEAAGGLPAHTFKPGDDVVVEEGPLAGLRGVFQGPPGPAERVYILLHFLGQANRTEVPVAMLQHAPEEGGAGRRGTRGRGRRIRYKEVA